MRRSIRMFLFTTLLTACSEPPEPQGRAAPKPARREGAWAPLHAPSPPPALAAARGLITPEPHGTPATVQAAGGPRVAALKPLIDAIAFSEGIDPALVHAVIRQESSYNPGVRSPKDAVGLMQLIPATAQRFGLPPAERTDPAKNVRAGIRYLKWLYRYLGDWTLAVAAYNAGEGAVVKYGRRIPPYPETQHYVRRVFGFYTLYRQQQERLRSVDEQRQRPRSRSLAMQDSQERSHEPTPGP